MTRITSAAIKEFVAGQTEERMLELFQRAIADIGCATDNEELELAISYLDVEGKEALEKFDKVKTEAPDCD